MPGAYNPDSIVTSDVQSLYNRLHNGTFQHWLSKGDGVELLAANEISFWHQRRWFGNEFTSPVGTQKPLRLVRVASCPGPGDAVNSPNTDGGQHKLRIFANDISPTGFNASYAGTGDFSWGLVQYLRAPKKLCGRTITVSCSLRRNDASSVIKAYIGVQTASGVLALSPALLLMNPWQRLTLKVEIPTSSTTVAVVIIPVSNDAAAQLDVSTVSVAVGSYEDGLPMLDDLWDIMFPPGTCIIVRGSTCPEGWLPVTELHKNSSFSDGSSTIRNGRLLMASDGYAAEAGGAGNTLGHSSHVHTVIPTPTTAKGGGSSVGSVYASTSSAPKDPVNPAISPEFAARDNMRPYYTRILICERLGGISTGVPALGEAPEAITDHEGYLEWFL